MVSICSFLYLLCSFFNAKLLVRHRHVPELLLKHYPARFRTVFCRSREGERRPFELGRHGKQWKTMSPCPLMRPFDLLNTQTSASQHNGVYVPFYPAGVPVVKTLTRLGPTFSTKMAPVLTTRATLFKTHPLTSAPFRIPKMAPKLPQELFDRLIDFIALGEEVGTMDDLKSCSLIAKSWARTSQRHILKAISIPSFDRLFAWASEIDLARGTSSCVRTVTLCGEVARRFSPEELAGLEPHLSAFVNLECLNLIKFHLHSGIEHAKLILNSFGLFRTKLNTLQLESCSLSPNVFQSFLHLFPRLDNVHIGKGCLAVIKTADDILLRPPLGGTKNLRGSLVTETDTPREFFPCLLTIPLHFHHLECILSKESHEVISACAATLELLSFAGTFSFTGFIGPSRLISQLFRRP